MVVHIYPKSLMGLGLIAFSTFILDDINAEISICDKEKEEFTIGDTVKLTILDDGKVTVLK